MKIDIVENVEEEICQKIEDREEIIRRTVTGALDYEECPYECQVSVTLTDDEEIREMNLTYRGLDRSTDVLSFPAALYPVPGDFSDIEERDPYAFHPETGELMLGDIVISMDHVFSQAQEYGHSAKRELAFLIAHSMLHLLGYDHMTDDERIRMEERQEEILTRAGYIRSLQE